MDLEKIKSDQAAIRETVSAHKELTSQILAIAGIIVALALAVGGITFKTKADEAKKSLNEITKTLEEAKFLKNYIDDLSKKVLQIYTDLSNQRAKAKAAQEIPSKPREEIEQELKFSKDFEQLSQISDVPLPASHYFNRAYNSAALGKHEKAIELYTEAIKLKPDYLQAYGNRGNCHRDIKNFDAAMKDYNKVIELDPKDPLAYYNRGNLFGDLGKKDEAIRDFTKAINLKPDYAEAYSSRSVLFRTLGKYEEAEQGYNEAIKLDPNLADAYNNRGALFAKLKKYEEAEQDYNKAIELNPNDAVAYANRYLLHKKLGNKKEATSDYKRAIELDPSMKEILEKLSNNQ